MFGFGSSRAKKNGSIGVEELDAMLTANRGTILLDVREPFELTAFGKIPGVVNIPLGALVSRSGELPADKETPVVAVCQSGSRSLKARAILGDLGYRNVYSLDGGTLGWLAVRRG